MDTSSKISAEEEKETPRDELAALCYEVSDDEWVLNKRKLRAVLASEGLRLLEAECLSRSSLSATGVVLLSDTQVSLLPIRCQPKFVAMSSKGSLVRLINGHISAHLLHVSKLATKQTIIRWLKGDDKECIVCFEENCDFLFDCQCGYVTCIGCRIDLLSLAETEMTYACPNCRREMGPIKNLILLSVVITEYLETPEANIKAKMVNLTTARLAFIEKITGIDLTLPRGECVEIQHVKLRFAVLKFRDKHDIDRMDEWSPRQTRHIYNELRQDIERLHKLTFEEFEKECRRLESTRKKVVRASADSNSPAAFRPHFGCANCGKQFWDKCERKRAPKCLKCKRTAYCCAKCRKTHRRAHAEHCAANKKKPKRRAKKKKPKKGCAPY